MKRYLSNDINSTSWLQWNCQDCNKIWETKLFPSMTFQEATDEIEKEGINYFYISMCENDVLGAIEEEDTELIKQLELILVYITDLGIYIAVY